MPFKQIKPKPLKADAMRLVLLNEMRAIGRDIRKDFVKTQATWDEQVKFEILISLVGGVTVFVETNDQRYQAANYGTDPYTIRPKNKSALRFPLTYTRKSIPNQIASRPGGAEGPYIYAKVVNHPGIEAGNFEKIIYRKWKRAFKRRMEKGMKKARAASGHAI